LSKRYKTAMGAIAHDFEEKVKRAIRDAMAMDPLLTQGALIAYLNKKFNHSFDFRFVSRTAKEGYGLSPGRGRPRKR
jgi:hypothetical protein